MLNFIHSNRVNQFSNKGRWDDVPRRNGFSRRVELSGDIEKFSEVIDKSIANLRSFSVQVPFSKNGYDLIDIVFVFDLRVEELQIILV